MRGVQNLGEPIRFTNVEPLAGFSASSGRPGEVVKVWTCLALTSHDRPFHRITQSLAGVVAHLAQQERMIVRLDHAHTVLLVFKADRTAQLWLDTAAVTLRCAAKNNLAAGSVVFEQDIADVTGMAFPAINLEPTDKILCLFRDGWRFGLAFDFNPECNLDIERFTRMLGGLYRELRYSDLYEAVANKPVFARLIGDGWFPFVEIVSAEFNELVRHCEAGFDMVEMNDRIIAKFDESRLQKMLGRWLQKSHFAAKKDLLVAAVEAFKRHDPIAVIKIALTEIEGVLNDAYRAAHNGQGAKIKELLKFAIQSAHDKAGEPNSLLMPMAFADYLDAHTFANFDPVRQTGGASSRHAVGHGAAKSESYTMPRALQVILTLDQLAFYT